VTTHYAVIDGVGAVHGIGMSEQGAEQDAARGLAQAGLTLGDCLDATTVPCTAAAYRYVTECGGAPSQHLIVSRRDGVSLRSEEEET
jgi:hypothetical protein